MKFSIVMHTCREDNAGLPAPVLQMMLNSMVRQDYSGEFELIIVDLLWERRRKDFERMCPGNISTTAGVEVPVLYVPDKTSPFKDRGLLRIATPKNTGLLFARGTHVIFTDDCQIIPENALTLFSEWAEKGAGATMCYEKRICGGSGGNDRTTGVDQRGAHIGVPTGTGKIVTARDIGFLGGTMSMVPIETLEAVNGWDEMFDGSRQLEDADMILRLAAHGQLMAYENRARIIEYECGNYGDVVSTQPIKCNGAYAQYVWGLGRRQANRLSGDQLVEAIRRSAWTDCLRINPDQKCIPHLSPCTKLGEKDVLEAVYNDKRITFDLAEKRKNVNTSWEDLNDAMANPVLSD